MRTFMKSAVLAGVSAAMVGAAVSPASAAGSHGNIQLARTHGQSAKCWSMGGSQSDAAKMTLRGCENGLPTQVFRFKKAAKGWYTVWNKHSGMCLYAAGHSTGAKVKQATRSECRHKYTSMQWKWSGGRFYNRASGKVITTTKSAGSRSLLTMAPVSKGAAGRQKFAHR
ncbi:RICIN domain-containing protein [Streptomyces sp. MS1.AVA.3]|uniref:RICIN domain-containing protein n=1 Tax=Streptomyces decoyicus TaxID=249567 RepID=UPI0030C4D342